MNNSAPARDTYSLETNFVGKNETRGVIFDVSTSKGIFELEIVALDAHIDLIKDDCQITVFGRKGSHLNSNNSNNDWSTLVNGTIVCLGMEQRSVIPSKLFREKVVLQGGETYSFYILMPKPSIIFTKGTTQGAISASSKYLNIHEGIKAMNLSETETEHMNDPLIWNGAVKYRVNDAMIPSPSELSPVCDSMLTTSFDDNIGSFGNMFDVTTHESSIEVYGMNIYTDVKDLVSYEIFTRSGSFQEGINPSVSLNMTESDNVDALKGNSNLTNVEYMSILNWTLVKRGTAVGKGNHKGTLIQGFVPFTIPKNSTQGFYITLTQPDLRYQSIQKSNPDAKVGDIYFDNEDIDILIGVSVGTYPASTVFFGPRVWSGTIFYRAERECPSSNPSSTPSTTLSFSPSGSPSIGPSKSPSHQPSYSPTLFPSSSPTNRPSETPSRDISYYPSVSPSMLDSSMLGNCTDKSSLSAPLEGGTKSYGAMFTVTSLKKVGITTMDIHVAEKKEILVEVYTKIGDYKKFAENPDSWRLVARSNIIGAGEGKLTKIPEADFDDVFMRANETRAFYVTLSTADLKYTRTRIAAGKPFISDSFLRINAGEGVASKLFGGSRFSPRIFNGALHYIFKGDCDDKRNTNVIYDFNVTAFEAVEESEILQIVNESIYQTAKGLMSIDPTLRSYKLDYKLDLKDLSTFVNPSRTCEASDEFSRCYPIQTEFRFSHHKTLQSGKVVVAMLKFQNSFENNLIDVGIQAQYDGDVGVQAEIVVNLEGTFNASLTDDEMQYFQAITRAYLNSNLAKMGVNVLDVVASQNKKRDTRFLQRGDGISETSTIAISTMIDGSYRPPPEIDFPGVVEDALDVEEGNQFRDDIVSGRRDIPPDIAKKIGLLKGVTKVNSSSILQQESIINEIPQSNVLTQILGGVLGLLLLFLVACYWYCRKRRRKQRQKNHPGYFSNGPMSNSKEYHGSSIIDADCHFQDEDSISDENLQTFLTGPSIPCVDTLSTSSGRQECFGVSSRSFASGNQSFVSAKSLAGDVVERRYETLENSSVPEEAWSTGALRMSQNLQDALRMRSQSTLECGEGIKSHESLQSSLEKSMSSLETNGLMNDESITFFDRSSGRMDSTGRMHFPMVSVRNLDCIPVENRRLSPIRQSINKGRSVVDIRHSDPNDLHNRSIKSLDLTALRNLSPVRDAQLGDMKSRMNHHSCGDFRFSSGF